MQGIPRRHGAKSSMEYLAVNYGVTQQIRAGLEAEEALYRRQREQFHAQMSSRRERDRVKQELVEVRAKLQQTEKDQAEVDVVAVEVYTPKAFILSMLSDGKKKGGNEQQAKNRYIVSGHVRRSADLSPDEDRQ